MRRKDREMPEAFAWQVVDKCEWAVLGVVDFSGNPYCIPVSIVRDGRCIYFHSARNGLKIDCLRNKNRICISCVGDTYRPQDAFTTEFESAILRGKAFEVVDENERIHALRLLCERFQGNKRNFIDNR